MRYSQPLVLVLALCSLVGCSEDEPTVEEFVAEFNAAAIEFESVSAELFNQPMPIITGDRNRDLQSVATMLKTDAAKFDTVIERFENLKAPSDPPEAEQLRARFLEMIVFMRDDMLRQAKALDSGQRPKLSNSYEKTIIAIMGKIADLLDQLGMDSSEFRKLMGDLEPASVE